MTCDVFKTYTTGVPTGYTTDDHHPRFRVYSEQWFDNWPALLMSGGMTCQQARDYIAANWQFVPDLFDESAQPIILPRLIVKADTFIPLCDAVNWNGGTGGIFIARDLSDLNPVTIGGINTEFVCTPSASYLADGSWGRLTFEGFVSSNTTWLPTCDIIGTVDINKWFCCRTACCGSGIVPSAGGTFLIPSETLPDPVDEKATVPILNNPLYLSNHTYAVANNYGRIKK